jgi:hypothetical protein
MTIFMSYLQERLMVSFYSQSAAVTANWCRVWKSGQARAALIRDVMRSRVAPLAMAWIAPTSAMLSSSFMMLP